MAHKDYNMTSEHFSLNAGAYNISHEQSSTSLQKLFGYIFIIACLNPWTSFGTNSMDSQPWPLLSGIIYISLLRNIILPPYFWLFSLCITTGVIISLAISNHPPVPDIARAIASYGTLMVVYLGFYNHLIRHKFPKKLLIFAGASWIAFAFVEMSAPSITSTLSAQRTSAERGLTSLAPEPTFFAIFLLFFSWILAASTRYKPTIKEIVLIVICIASIVALARSAMVILYLLTTALLYGAGVVVRSILRLRLRKKHLAMLTLSLMAIFSVFYSIKTTFSESRAGMLFAQVIDFGPTGIMNILSRDASISRRLEDAVLSIHAALANLGAPGGIDTFIINRESVRDFWGTLFWYPSTGNKIMSWNGVLLYELGVFGLIAYLSLILAAKRNNGASNTEIIILVTLLIGAIPIAFPLIPMLFALWAYFGLSSRRTLKHSCAQHSNRSGCDCGKDV